MDVIWRSSLSVAPSGWWWEAASWPRTCTCGTGSAWWSCPGTRPGPGGSPSSGWTSATTGSTASLTVPAHSPETMTRITNTCIFTGTFSHDSCLAGSSFAAHVRFLTCERVLWCDSECSVFRRSCFHWGTHLKSFQWETPDRSVGLKRKKWLWSARIRGV